MDADLVRAAGFGHERHGRAIAVVRRGAFEDLPARAGCLAARVDDHPPAGFARRDFEQRCIDHPLVPLGRAVDERPIGLADGAFHEQLRQFLVRARVARQHQAARGIAVEPVRRLRRPVEALAQCVEVVFKAFGRLRPRMYRESRGLVQHQQMRVDIENAGSEIVHASAHASFRGAPHS